MKVFLAAVMCLSAGNLYGAPEDESGTSLSTLDAEVKTDASLSTLYAKVKALEGMIKQLAKHQQVHPMPEGAQPQTTYLDPRSQPSGRQFSAPTLIPNHGKSAVNERRYQSPQPNTPTERVHSPRTVPFNPNAPLPKGWQRLNLNEQYYIFIVPVEGETLGVSSEATSITQGELQMDIKSFANPLREGTRTKYAITVKNSASVTDEQIILRVQFPQELTPDATSIKSIVPAHISGNEMKFDPVANLRSGESISFEIPVTVNQVGRSRIRAVLTSNNTPHGIHAVEPIDVIGR
jgi:hypothetical protein